MKKLFLGAAIAVSSLTFAQQFGAKAGMNVSSLSKDASLADQSSKVGYYAGVFLNAPLAQDFSIQPEVLYNNLGSKVTLTETNVGGTTYKNEAALHLNYISVPVMFQYNVAPGFRLEAGPEFSFMISANNKLKRTENGTTTGSATNNLNRDNFNTFNFGMGLGAGYNFTQNIGINVRYVAGFTDIRKNGNGDGVRNNNLQAGLEFKF